MLGSRAATTRSSPIRAVMAITHVYIAPASARRRGCAPLPTDARIHWTRTDGRDVVPPGRSR